ncbi:hypothetical protein AB0F59_13045 [Micromonospora lupini]
MGRHGADVATGQAIQLVGVLTALVAGVFATNAVRRVPQRSEPTAPLA